jgi:hypothetical protein
MGIFVIWLVLSILAGVLASTKGRSGFGFFLLSVILSPLIGLIAAAIASPNVSKVEEAKVASGESKRCPHCAEIIKTEALVCRFCNRELATKQPTAVVAESTATHDELMAQFSISHDGEKYQYEQHRYDRLEDAVAYARLHHHNDA